MMLQRTALCFSLIRRSIAGPAVSFAQSTQSEAALVASSPILSSSTTTSKRSVATSSKPSLKSAPTIERTDLSTVQIPEYLDRVYWWAYIHPNAVKFFERQWLADAILFGNYAKLRDAALQELLEEETGKMEGNTLQVACAYGDLTPTLASRLAPSASLDVVDVAPIQLKNLQQKLDSYSSTQARVQLGLQNADNLGFDNDCMNQVLFFFLLHEIPLEVREKALEEAWRVCKPGGKIVFVDYHKPASYSPHRYLMPLVLQTLEPFAMDMWRQEISEWLPKDAAVDGIRKDTYFGGLYQKVVITKQKE
jgi:ubiquinone/menaquinone biosynthesis C-methylase UbiE